MNVKAGNNRKKAAKLSGFIKGGNHSKIFFNIYLSEGFSSIPSFFHPLCWNHLWNGKGKETFFEILPFNFSKGAFHG